MTDQNNYLHTEVERLRAFIAEFALYDFPAISGRASDPQDDLDDVTELGPVLAWQDDAWDMLRMEPKKGSLK